MFSIADNFQIQEISFPSGSEVDLGSWVSMTIDSLGRLIIARESKGLIRVTLSATGDSVESIEWINRDLQECRGLTFRGKDLFVNANNSKGLYRLRSAGDGFSETRAGFLHRAVALATGVTTLWSAQTRCFIPFMVTQWTCRAMRSTTPHRIETAHKVQKPERVIYSASTRTMAAWKSSQPVLRKPLWHRFQRTR